MKKVIFVLLMTAVLGITASAQKVKSNFAALPAGIAEWTEDDADKLISDPAIDARLKKLLGAKSYAALKESFETMTPIVKDGKVLFVSGCLIHACTHAESAVAIDTANNTIHAAIFRDEKKTVYFNERRSKTPAAISGWARNLTSRKK